MVFIASDAFGVGRHHHHHGRGGTKVDRTVRPCRRIVQYFFLVLAVFVFVFVVVVVVVVVVVAVVVVVVVVVARSRRLLHDDFTVNKMLTFAAAVAAAAAASYNSCGTFFRDWY